MFGVLASGLASGAKGGSKGSFWDQIKTNYSNPLSYFTGGPGWWNGATAGLEGMTGMFSSLDRQKANEAANEQAMAMRREEIALQKEFAKNGIRWRVEDAKRAGLSPLAALGAAGASYGGATATIMPDHSSAEISDRMGQNISRAMQTTRTPYEQEMAKLSLSNAQADLDGKVIDNQIRASQLRNLNQGQSPGIPSAGGTGEMIKGQRQAVNVTPSEVIASESQGSPVQAGAINTLQYTRESSGNIGITMSKDAKERNEDDFVAETLWHLKNRTSPPPPSREKFPLPHGMSWEWNFFKQEFEPKRWKYKKGENQR